MADNPMYFKPIWYIYHLFSNSQGHQKKNDSNLQVSNEISGFGVGILRIPSIDH